MSIINLDEYKAYAGINSGSKDSKLESLVDFVNSYVASYCNKVFSPTIVTNFRCTALAGEIVLPNAPVASVEEIRLFATSEVLTDFVVESEEGIVAFLDTLEELETSKYGISIDYTYGYTTIPLDLEVACYELVTHYEKREFNKSRSIGGEASDYGDPQTIPPQVKGTLDLHRML